MVEWVSKNDQYVDLNWTFAKEFLFKVKTKSKKRIGNSVKKLISDVVSDTICISRVQ